MPRLKPAFITFENRSTMVENLGIVNMVGQYRTPHAQMFDEHNNPRPHLKEMMANAFSELAALQENQAAQCAVEPETHGMVFAGRAYTFKFVCDMLGSRLSNFLLMGDGEPCEYQRETARYVRARYPELSSALFLVAGREDPGNLVLPTVEGRIDVSDDTQSDELARALRNAFAPLDDGPWPKFVRDAKAEAVREPGWVRREFWSPPDWGMAPGGAERKVGRHDHPCYCGDTGAGCCLIRCKYREDKRSSVTAYGLAREDVIVLQEDDGYPD